MYAGGPVEPLRELMCEDSVWHVPGTSPIAGDYHGRAAVIDYFLARRALAGGRIDITKHAELVHGDVLIQLADGRARLGGSEEHEWRTAGVYRVAGRQLAEAWLVPLDLRGFDRAWNAARREPYVYAQRVRRQDCDASAILGHPRLLELLEDAFIELWASRLGPLDDTLGPNRRLTLRAIEADVLASIRLDDTLRIELSVDRLTRRALHLRSSACVNGAPVARARSVYICVNPNSGHPAAWPQRAAEALAEAARPG